MYKLQSPQDPARRGPSPAQINAAYLRSEITTLEQRLCELLPALPAWGEPGSQELRDLRGLIDLLLETLDAHSEFWNEEYIRKEAQRYG